MKYGLNREDKPSKKLIHTMRALTVFISERPVQLQLNERDDVAARFPLLGSCRDV